MNNYAPFQTAEKVCRARAREETKAKKRKEEGKKGRKKDIGRRRWNEEKRKVGEERRGGW